ncbi:MAG: hypothetical protein J0I18_00350 [Actinobacteria bacterium]|nr:hypothetical protein [Actinomycetota bacterium]
MPEESGGTPIKYREWDVNPYAKGQDGGGERLITGSDGSAYFTEDHYKHMLKLRGSSE